MENIHLSKLINDIRYNCSLSQRELASLIGTDDTTISFWERGLRCPTMKHLKKIIDIATSTAGIDIDREHVIIGNEK